MLEPVVSKAYSRVTNDYIFTFTIPREWAEAQTFPRVKLSFLFLKALWESF